MKVWTVNKYDNDEPIEAPWVLCGVTLDKEKALKWAREQVLENKLSDWDLVEEEFEDTIGSDQVKVMTSIVARHPDDQYGEREWGYIIKDMEVVE